MDKYSKRVQVIQRRMYTSKQADLKTEGKNTQRRIIHTQKIAFVSTLSMKAM